MSFVPVYLSEGVVWVHKSTTTDLFLSCKKKMAVFYWSEFFNCYKISGMIDMTDELFWKDRYVNLTAEKDLRSVVDVFRNVM